MDFSEKIMQGAFIADLPQLLYMHDLLACAFHCADTDVLLLPNPAKKAAYPGCNSLGHAFYSSAKQKCFKEVIHHK